MRDRASKQAPHGLAAPHQKGWLRMFFRRLATLVAYALRSMEPLTPLVVLIVAVTLS